MITDIHTHLDLITSFESMPELINKCTKEGIKTLFNISVDVNSNFIGHKLAKEYKNVFFSVGLHPEVASEFNLKEYNKIEPLINDKKCIGIGEIGLDYYRDKRNVRKQKELFEFQLNIAKKYKKSIILHTRDSFDDAFAIINKEEFKDLRGVFHCFSYTIEEAKKILDRGFHISFAGNLTFKNARNLQEAAKYIPIDKILVETDAPFLTPVPFRGKKNYPYLIKYTIKFLSELRNMPINELIEELKKNVEKLYDCTI